MQELVSADLWKRASKVSRRASIHRCAVAYVSSDSLIEFGSGDTLITDASTAAIKSGQTSAHVLKRANDRGAAIYSYPGLHAKVLVFDRIAVIGSANLSLSSANQLTEAALFTDDPSTVSAAIDLISQLEGRANRLKTGTIEKLCRLKVIRRGGKRGVAVSRQRSAKITPRPGRTWLVRFFDVEDDEYPDEADAARRGVEEAAAGLEYSDSEVNWIRMTGTSAFRRDARPGDWIIGIHGPTFKRPPTTVYAPLPILHRQDEDKWTRLHYEDFSDSEDTAVTWGAFKKLAARADIPYGISPNATRRLGDEHARNLRAIWPGLGSG
jgi:hypothetical protein